MNKEYKFLLVGLLIFSIGCSTPKEAVMPFRNLGYTAETIFPVQGSEAEWIFRVWVNNGTSVDRIITVSRDSLIGDESCIIELGTLYRKHLFRERKERINNLINVKPKSGIDKFIQDIDSLDLENYKTQKDFGFFLDHNPTSLYIVELKKRDEYHKFSFRTYFPMSLTKTERKVDEQYEFIEKLLFDEFGYRFYMK